MAWCPVACVDVLVAGVVEGAGDEAAEVHQGLRVVTPDQAYTAFTHTHTDTHTPTHAHTHKHNSNNKEEFFYRTY